MRRTIAQSVVALLLAPLSVYAEPFDPVGWRDYLTPSEWKTYRSTIDVFIDASAGAAYQKTACKMPLGSDAEDQFLVLLTGTGLLRPDNETTIPKEKWRAWQHLFAGTGCDRGMLSTQIGLKQRWYSELLKLQVRGLKNRMDGGRKYR